MPLSRLPTPEPILAPAAEIFLTAASGFGVVLTINPSFFLDGDVGRQIRMGPARAVIRAFISALQVTVDILDPFPSTGPFAAGTWTLDGSPNAGTLTLSSGGPRARLSTRAS